MTLRQSTKVWLALFGAGLLLGAVNRWIANLGCLGALGTGVAVISGLVLLNLATTAAFRAIVRGLALRLAFSYFLIGVVPIPLLALLLASAAYVLAFQIIAGRVEREIRALAEAVSAESQGIRAVRIDSGTVRQSNLPWLAPGQPAGWAASLQEPQFVLAGREAWLAIPRSGELLLVPFTDPRWTQQLADRTGYTISIEVGSERQSGRSYEFDLGDRSRIAVGETPVTERAEERAPSRPSRRDYLPMPDGRTAVAIGDVSGHGLPTGLLAAMAKAALSTLVESGLTGSPLFLRLNELIHRSTDSRNSMTLALFAYDAGYRVGELTNAGQLAPYRLTGSSVESLALPSFPLGVSLRSEFPTRAFSFSSGDRLLLLTDGFVEAVDRAGEPFGFERLEALLRAEAGSDTARLREALLSAVASYTGGAPADDDRTLVLLTLD